MSRAGDGVNPKKSSKKAFFYKSGGSHLENDVTEPRNSKEAYLISMKKFSIQNETWLNYLGPKDQELSN